MGRVKTATGPTIIAIVSVALVTLDTGNCAPATSVNVLRVGPHQNIKTIGEAARLAQNGDTIEIDAADYVGDTAVWSASDIKIRGVNGRPRLIAAGRAAEEKAIWVVRGRDIVIEDIVFTGARVPHRNGAGIRLESGKLTVRRCLFIDNEDGMLVGNDPSTVLEIEDSEFAYNGAGDGQSHNLYVGAIQRLVVTGSYFHHGKVGHLLKSRARASLIQYNRLTDESGGRASYELEFPSGGFAVVVGNLIEQSEDTENPVVISFGAEGYSWQQNELHISHNTIVNDRRQSGVFVSVKGDAENVNIRDNILVGNGEMIIPPKFQPGTNWFLEKSDFADAAHLDYRLRASAAVVGMAKDPGFVAGVFLRPSREYVHPTSSIPLAPGQPLSPGAFQGLVE